MSRITKQEAIDLVTGITNISVKCLHMVSAVEGQSNFLRTAIKALNNPLEDKEDLVAYIADKETEHLNTLTMQLVGEFAREFASTMQQLLDTVLPIAEQDGTYHLN